MAKKTETKTFFFTLPISMYQQLVNIQFAAFKKDKKYTSIASLVREAIGQYLTNKKEE